MEKYDIIIIGGGPGGYVAAIKATKLGLAVALVENHRVGGTCLNRGCIPAKAMLHASARYREILESAELGIPVSGVTYDYQQILKYKEDTTNTLVQGVEQLLKANGVTQICGTGKLLPGNRVQVTGEEGEKILSADSVILAAGSRPLVLPIEGMDLPGVLTSDELFALEKVPESLTIIGGGVIGVEFATIFSALGSQVTILEALPSLLSNMDKEISQNLRMILRKRGVDIHTAAQVQRIQRQGETLSCTFLEKEKEQTVQSQYVLCAVGRCPNTEGLFGEGAEPAMERGRILVDENFQTSIAGVYAIGDLVKGAQLAHVASAQGVVTVEHLAGKTPSIDLSVVPGCVYTDPEIASAGLTEAEAKAQGIPVRTGKFIMSANGKSLITKEERGFIKIVASEESGEILGVQMMCARATDMVGEFVTAISNHMTVSQLLRGMRAHPTYNEAIGEALEELEGGAIHVVPKRKR